MDNLKLMKRSDLDQYQMDNRTFDDEKDAWRVSIVDGITLTADSINLPEQKVIEVPVIVKEAEIHQINVPVIVKEVQIERVEVPVVVKETVYVDKLVVVPEIKIVEIEKPVIIKEIEYKIIEKLIPVTPNIVKICMIIQAIAYTGLLLVNIFLKGR